MLTGIMFCLSTILGKLDNAVNVILSLTFGTSKKLQAPSFWA